MMGRIAWALLLASGFLSLALSLPNGACQLQNGLILKDGQKKSLEVPCVRLRCKNGTIRPRRCPRVASQDDPLCSPYPNVKGRFPKCCPIAMACPNGRR